MNLKDFVNASVTELAEITGIDKGNISKIDRGRLISERTLLRMAALTGLTTAQVLQGINDRRQKVVKSNNSV